MFQKIVYVGGIVAAVIVVMVVITIIMPFIKDMADIVANDTTVGNYAGYNEAGAAMPIWLYAIPVLVGGVSIFLRLRRDD